MAHLKKFASQAAYNSGKYDLDAPAVSLISGVGIAYDKTIPEGPATFGGLEIASGPLAYENGAYVIKDDWNHDSYNSVYGKNNGSTYFNFLQMGELFEKSGFSTSDGDIENLLDPFDGWRMPTQSEWCTLTTGASPGTSREGSIVNGNAGSKYALIQLTGVTHAGSSTPVGLLLFPDDATITGKTLSGINNTTCTTGVAGSELAAYLDQGCAFLPASGYCDFGSWYYGGSSGYWWSATQYDESIAYFLVFYSSYVLPSSNDFKSVSHSPVRLVKPV